MVAKQFQKDIHERNKGETSVEMNKAENAETLQQRLSFTL